MPQRRVYVVSVTYPAHLSMIADELLCVVAGNQQGEKHRQALDPDLGLRVIAFRFDRGYRARVFDELVREIFNGFDVDRRPTTLREKPTEAR